VRRISEEFFLHVGFTKEWASRLKLVVDELFMNSSRYGSGSNESKIYIYYQFDNDEATFRIEDEGTGDKKVSAEELKKLIHKNSTEVNDLTKTCGRGLALISSLWTDGMAIEDSSHGGIAISFTKKIFSEMAPAPAPRPIPVAQSDGLAQISPVVAKGSTEVVKISGEIDQSNMEEKIRPITEVLDKLPHDSVLVLDCEKLLYINSTFIGHLAAWLNQIQTKGGQMVLKNINKEVREVLNLVGLSKVIYLEA